MRKYEIDFYDKRNGATSPIDTVEAPAGYTAEQYIEDCKKNADKDWNDMLAEGEVTVIDLCQETEGNVEVGMTYSDPEGEWKVTEVNGDKITIVNIQDGNPSKGVEGCVSREEALYYLTQ